MIDSLQYENCWFEIRTIRTRIVTRDRKDFTRKSGALSKLQNVTLYRIEKSNSGMERFRLHILG